MAVSTDKLSQAFSLALEERSTETQDLVTNSNVILAVLKKRGRFKTYSGPTIRYRVNYAQTGTSLWYDGYQFLNPLPADLVQDAEFTPKMLANSPTISGEEMLQNMGRNQLMNIFDLYIDVAQGELKDEMARALHSNGTGNGGKELIGLQAAVPTDPTSGTYGSIARSNTWWRTNVYDAHTNFSGIGTQVSSTTVRQMYEKITIETSRAKDGPSLILADQNHYTAFSAALVNIQRVTRAEGEAATLGFRGLSFAGAGREMEVVLEGGIGTNMPSNVSYFLDMNGMEVRYHPQRNFTPFNGRQTPANQDAIVQHIGWMGELCMYKPIHQSKLYDSNLGS
jgi:hypothetical protein